MKERYHRPVIAFAVVSEDELKGSARSVPDLNIRDVLAAMDKDHPGLNYQIWWSCHGCGFEYSS